MDVAQQMLSHHGGLCNLFRLDVTELAQRSIAGSVRPCLRHELRYFSSSATAQSQPLLRRIANCASREST
jgi:hypothetical protein